MLYFYQSLLWLLSIFFNFHQWVWTRLLILQSFKHAEVLQVKKYKSVFWFEGTYFNSCDHWTSVLHIVHYQNLWGKEQLFYQLILEETVEMDSRETDSLGSLVLEKCWDLPRMTWKSLAEQDS